MMPQWWLSWPVALAVASVLNTPRLHSNQQADRNADRVPSREEPLFRAGEPGAYGFINRHGDIVIPFKYELAASFAISLELEDSFLSRCQFRLTTTRRATIKIRAQLKSASMPTNHNETLQVRSALKAGD